MSQTRRRLLQLGLGGGALLSLGALGLALQPGSSEAPPAALEVLDARTWTILAAVADTLAPPSGPSPRALQVAVRVDRQLGRMHPADAAEVIQAVQLLENGLVGLFFGGGVRPFTESTPAQRAAVLEGWRTSSLPLLRTAFRAIRGLVVTAYYSHPEAYVAAGYPGPPDFGQASAPALQSAQVPPPVEPPAADTEEVPG